MSQRGKTVSDLGRKSSTIDTSGTDLLDESRNISYYWDTTHRGVTSQIIQLIGIEWPVDDFVDLRRVMLVDLSKYDLD